MGALSRLGDVLIVGGGAVPRLGASSCRIGGVQLYECRDQVRSLSVSLMRTAETRGDTHLGSWPGGSEARDQTSEGTCAAGVDRRWRLRSASHDVQVFE